MKNTIKLHDTVAYTAKYLRSTGNHSGPLPQARGTVTEITEYSGGITLATIDWNTSAAPEQVNTGNLIPVKRIAIDSALQS